MIGKSLLHYEITKSIGKGGMGEVYAARDTKLGREVAIKILPAELTGDPEREARFQREARALASLQHANVASVYGFEETEGLRFLVMELISGKELGERLESGPVPVAEVREVARQIAAGLEAAHEAGIVHRDLKPANIMETDEGEVKILDFGLAQAWFGDSPDSIESAASPTVTAAMTQTGAILGTAAYMSPEQARGAAVDRRTDIWAFGVILFELLTGHQLFRGETTSDTLAAVLRKEPDWESLPVDEAPELCRLVERCLVRDPKQRLRDIGEARIFLQDGLSSTSLSFSQLNLSAYDEPQKQTRLPAALIGVIALVCLLGGAGLGWKVLARPQPAPLLHAMIPAPKDTDFELSGGRPGPAVISPDGTKVCFSARNEVGVTKLYIRHLDEGESIAMSGTEGAAYPFWSPDSEYIGYYDDLQNKLKKVAAAGGPPVTLCTAPNAKGASWNKDGVIIFAPDYNDAIFRIPAIGGEPEKITTVDSQHDSHRHPRFLPDGQQFIYIARAQNGGDHDIFLASLDTTVTPRIIGQTQSNAEYVQGYLLTVREGVLMATAFTPDQERPTDGAIPLVENIMRVDGAALAIFSPSPTGMMVYQTGVSNEAGQVLSWMELENGAQVALGESGQIFHPSISPDGTLALIEVNNASNEGTDLWLVDLDTGLRTRFTFADGDERLPAWSPDGQTVYYSSSVGGTFRIMQQPLEGRGGAAILFESSRYAAPTSIDPHSEFLLIDHEREDGNIEVQRLALNTGDGTPEVLLSLADGNLGGGEYSPDGRWIAYHVESAAGWDIFVVAAEGGARKWQVTTDGAVYPKWSSDGTKLWVSLFSGQLKVYSVDGSGQTFRVGESELSVTVSSPSAGGCFYDLHPDGERILLTGVDPAFRTEVSHLHLVTDWQRALMR